MSSSMTMPVHNMNSKVYFLNRCVLYLNYLAAIINLANYIKLCEYLNHCTTSEDNGEGIRLLKWFLAQYKATGTTEKQLKYQRPLFLS